MSHHSISACRDNYEEIKTKILNCGLDEKAVGRSSADLSQIEDKGTIYLKKCACYPTGLALGCPLPQRGVEEMLWETAIAVRSHIQKIIGKGRDKGGLAFVPKSGYHTTIVNRTHYENSDCIEYLSPVEFQTAERVLLPYQRGPIIIDYNGMILAPTGTLLVPGYPKGECLFHVRQCLEDQVEKFKEKAPQTAHIKLGHLINLLDDRQLSTLLDFIYHLGESLNFSIAFSEVFTPLGNIPLDNA
ncbi:MAG: hypothetical protein M0036_03980 [Desulfobacteraceae bacterium]|nr:hypothetical protein [Desulfobacteraceae bacterium]